MTLNGAEIPAGADAMDFMLQAVMGFPEPPILYRLLSRDGERFKYSKPPADLKHFFRLMKDHTNMTAKHCYGNAQQAMISQYRAAHRCMMDRKPWTTLSYWEGFWWHADCPVPLHHAWNTTGSGEIVDFTMQFVASLARRPGFCYMGIKIPAEVVGKHVGTVGSMGTPLTEGRTEFMEGRMKEVREGRL